MNLKLNLSQRLIESYGRLSISGLALSGWFYIDSLRPSLLPRGLVAQSVVSAIWTLLGYGLGAALGLLISTLFKFKIPRVFKRLVFVIALMAGLIVTFTGSNWQKQQIELLQLSERAYPPILTFLLAIVIILLVLTIGKAIHAFVVFITNHLDRWFTRWLSYLGAIVLVIFLLYVSLSYGVLKLQQNLERGQRAFDPAVIQPASSLRSGSPESLVNWEGLGKKGREFVGTISGSYSVEPIRVYAGIDNEPDIDKRARLVFEELQRTEAFTRRAIVLYTPSGTGWVNEAAVAPVERFFDGDVASAAIQYSAVSSFLQFVINQDVAGQASSSLNQWVRGGLSEVPGESRPKLYLYGESLGSLGSQAELIPVDPLNFKDFFDGALWVGTPSAGRLWSRLMENPSYDFILFSEGKDLSEFEDGNLDVLMLYNPTDPVVRIGWDILFREPDWLKIRSNDLSPRMVWRPGLTFLQMLAELLKSSSQPSGVGHNYYDKLDVSWKAILSEPVQSADF